MVNKIYIPERGDIVWLDFNPQLGHEQRGRMPALVISYKAYNERIGLGIFCPITSKVKGYPFEVVIDLKKIKGAVLSDQVKSLDWKEKNAEFIEKVGGRDLEEVLEKIGAIIK